MKFKTLCAIFPSNSIAAFSTRHNHVVVCKYIVETANLLASFYFICLTFGLSSFIPTFSSTHNKINFSPSVQISCWMPSNLLCWIHMKRVKTYPSPCTLGFPAAFVQKHQRAVSDVVTGSISPFVKVVVHSNASYYD